MLGRVMAALRPGDLLLVVSGFGMEPIERRQAAARAVRRQPGAERHPRAAPDGFLLAFGTDVRPGRLTRGSVVDLAPDHPLLPRPARRPGHGRVRAHGHLRAGVQRGAADHVHPDLRVGAPGLGIRELGTRAASSTDRRCSETRRGVLHDYLLYCRRSLTAVREAAKRGSRDTLLASSPAPHVLPIPRHRRRRVLRLRLPRAPESCSSPDRRSACPS